MARPGRSFLLYALFSVVVGPFPISEAQVVAPSAAETAAATGLETSLRTKIKLDQAVIKFADSTTIKVPANAEIMGFECSTLPQFIAKEGLDDIIRLVALRDVRKSLEQAGTTEAQAMAQKLGNEQLQVIKTVAISQLHSFKNAPATDAKVREAIDALLKPNLRRYTEAIRKAQDTLWERLSPSLREQLVIEANAQTDTKIVAANSKTNLFKVAVAPEPKQSAQAPQGLKRSLLCFADIEIADDRVRTVIVPRTKSGLLDSSRNLVDVGFDMDKLEKPFVAEQE